MVGNRKMQPGQTKFSAMCATAAKWRVGIWVGLCFLCAGCSAAASLAVALPPSDTPAAQAWLAQLESYTTDEAAVTALILAERQAAMARDLPWLAQLWAAEARIVDGRNSATPADDYTWQGRAAILDRYQVAVFPFGLPPLAALDPATTMVFTEQTATVQHGADQWQLVKVDQRWWLLALRYGLSPQE